MNTISIIVIGKGAVGKALLRQLSESRTRLGKQGVDARVVGVAGRETAVFQRGGIDDADVVRISGGPCALETLAGGVVHGGWSDLAARIGRLGVEPVVVDVTAEDSAAAHAAWRKAGWRVVTANKKPLTSGSDVFGSLVDAPPGLGRYRFEATVGAGLPVIGTIADLLAAGDKVIEIRAAVSGTLGFIFSACEGGASFAEAVAQAKARGYTEPDPRDDLSGKDVARKALILARLAGRRLELGDIPVESLVPAKLAGCGVDEFMDGLDAFSGPVRERFEEAASKGSTLRYVLTISPETVRVGIEHVPKGKDFGALAGPENLFVLRTRRYDAAPLVIRGPGAGAEVTAAGVFADILRVGGV